MDFHKTATLFSTTLNEFALDADRKAGGGGICPGRAEDFCGVYHFEGNCLKLRQGQHSDGAGVPK